MKKSLLMLLLTIAFAFTACQSNELYIISDDTDTDNIGMNELSDISIPDYKYENCEVMSAVKPSEYIWYNRTSRGIMFMPNDGIIRVYNPEAGSLNPLCPDPLCTHLPYSGCPYGNCIFTGSIPTEYNGRLYYFVKDEYIKNEQQYNEYIIYSTDLTGQNINKLYQNSGDYMYGLTISDDRAFFLEFIDADNVQLKSISLNNGIISLLNTEKEAVVESFVIMNDIIYYILNTGELFSCTHDFENVSFEYNIKSVIKLFGFADTGKLYWILDNTIYEYDPSEKECKELISAGEGLHFANSFIEDDGIYYQMVPNEISYNMLYDDYLTGIRNYNTLYCLDPRTMQSKSYDLPEKVLLVPNTTIICNGLLISQTFIKNENTKKPGGRTYIAYDLKNQTEYTIIE